MTVAKVQHYVPQFLLRNFGSGKKDQVWVYDKSTGKSFRTNAKNIASESRFYDFTVSGQPATVDPILSRFEGNAKPVIARILQNNSLIGLTEESRAELSAFFALQLTRTRSFREQWREFPKLMRDTLESRGEVVARGSQAEKLLTEFTDNDSKAQTCEFMIRSISQFAPYIAGKHWVLATTTAKRPFLLSDNPLTRQNMGGDRERGNLGLASPGVEVYFPLSPLQAIAMWCPSLVEFVLDGAKKARSLPRNAASQDLFDLDKAIRGGLPVEYAAANVENFNSLQVANSERYLFSCVNDFTLADEMLALQPALRRGPRTQIAH